MRRGILVLFFLSCLSAGGQVPGKLKFDSLVWNKDSSLVWASYKNKSSIYSVAQEAILLEPTKLPVIYLQGLGGFVVLDNKQKRAQLIFSLDQRVFNLFSENGRVYVHIPAEFGVFEEVQPNLNGWLYISETGDLVKDTLPYQTNFWRSAEVQFLPGDRIRVEDYCASRFTYLDSTGQPDYTFSGIYDLVQKGWLIPSEYENCYVVDNYVFCLRPTGEKDESGNPFYVYDVFLSNAEGFELIRSGITELDQEELRAFLKADRLEGAPDGVHYVVEMQGRFGLVRFQLMDNWFTPMPDFRCEWLMPPVYDLIVFNSDLKTAATVQGRLSRQLTLYQYVDGMTDENYGVDEMRQLMIDSLELSLGLKYEPYQYLEKISGSNATYVLERHMSEPAGVTEVPYEGRFHNFSIRLLADSIVLIEQVEPLKFKEPLKSLLDPWNDSIDTEGNLVFPSEPAPEADAKVFNLSSKTWILDDESSLLFGSENGFMALYQTGYQETFLRRYDFTGRQLGGNISLTAATQDYEVLKILSGAGVSDTVFEAPGGFDRHAGNKERRIYYYVIQNGKMDLYSPNDDFSNSVNLTSADFLHYNPDLNYLFYSSHDSLYFKNEFYQVGVPLNEGAFISTLTSSVMLRKEIGYAVVYSAGSGRDTMSFGSLEGYQGDKIQLNIRYEKGLLIINDKVVKNDWFYQDAIFDGRLYRTVESENSSIWKKGKNGWEKCTPYYAGIHPAGPHFYIAHSGRYFASDGDPNDPDIIPVDVPQRYFLLDSNFKAISYADYFDFPDIQDLGFGLKIGLDGTPYYFFMTYQGEILTNAEWDDFEIERGKLKAVLNTVYLKDEFGDLILDEFGNPQEQVFETIRYFTLP